MRILYLDDYCTLSGWLIWQHSIDDERINDITLVGELIDPVSATAQSECFLSISLRAPTRFPLHSLMQNNTTVTSENMAEMPLIAGNFKDKHEKQVWPVSQNGNQLLIKE